MPEVQWEKFQTTTVFVVAGLLALFFVCVYLVPKCVEIYKLAKETETSHREQLLKRFDETIKRLENVVDNVIEDAKQQREHCSQELALQRQHDEVTQKSAWEALERQGDRIENYVKTILDYLTKIRGSNAP